MLNFRCPTLSDKQWMEKCIADGATDGCCYSFGNLIAWQSTYKIEVAEFEGNLIMRGSDEDGAYYVYPSGSGDIKACILAMIEYSIENNTVFRIEQVLKENMAVLEEEFSGMFAFSYDRNNSEYVYNVSDMADLPGKKFHAKKSHVNAFFRNHTDVSCCPITIDNIHECMAIEDEWLSEKTDDYGELAHEHKAIETVLRLFDKLNFSGAILYADGKAVAFTMGEKLKNNTFCTHYEKTLPDYKDAFPVINNGFTKLMLMSYDYVNREEDTGLEGLRKAKLSYHPAFFLDKYTAYLKKDMCRKYKATPDDIPMLKELWQTVFEDEDDVVDFFLSNTADINSVYAYRIDGKIVSAFYIIDNSIIIDGEENKSAYLYAAATLPEYRKKGIMSEMIKYASEILSSYGYSYMFLYPASDSLYDYYAKFGFKAAFFEKSYNISKNDIDRFSDGRYFRTILSYEEERKNISADSYVKFAPEYLDFARFCAKKYGVECDCIFDDEDKVFIIGRKDEDGNLIIDEALSSDNNYEHILCVISDLEFSGSATLNMPVNTEISGLEAKIKKSGMLLPLCAAETNKIIYFGQPCM